MDIVWRRMALDDLESARRYITEHNPRAAARVHVAIITSIGRLANHPNSAGRAVSTAPANWSCRARHTSLPTPYWASR